MTVAGHTFAEGPNGRRCTSTKYDDKLGYSRICDAAWLDVRNAEDKDVGLPGLAHSGNLSSGELSEIKAERVAEQERIWNAVSGIAGKSN